MFGSSNNEPAFTDYVEIFATYKFADIALIKSVLEGEDIIYYIQGEDIGVAPGGLPARVLVKNEQAEDAKQLLKEFQLI